LCVAAFMTLSNYIENDLRQRIRAGTPPCKLTLAGLSGFYRVSPMPVRRAVRALVAERLLHQEENGRLAVNGKPPATKRARGRAANVEPPRDWARVIAADVIRTSLCGRAEPLRLAATADRYGIGRTLVHRVFHRLAGAGLLDHTPRCGWRVHPFREADLDAYLEVRELLELRAIDLARPRLESAALKRLLDQNRPGDSTTPTRFDNGLHRYWIDQSGNRYIRGFFDRYGAYFAALLDYAAIGEPLLGELAAQHRTILEALLHKQWRQAKVALVRDIRRLRPILKDTIQRLEAGGGDAG
jgi:DNA-binding GntR family transcriptional regulator